MVRRSAVVALAILLVSSGISTEAFADGKGWRDLPPKLMLEDRPSWRNFEPSGGSGGGASAAGSWNEAMTLMPGLDIPDGVVKFVPAIPFMQTLMNDDELASLPNDVPIEVPEVLAEPIPDDFQPLSEGDKEMVEEGQKLWQDMLGLREKLLLEPTLLATKEGGKVVEEFHRMHESFEKIRGDLREVQQQAHPVVKELMDHFEGTFAPLRKVLDEQKGNAVVKICSIVIGPLFGAALRKAQLLSGVLALAEVVHVTSRIKETSAKDIGGMRKAGLHMQRADTGIVSAAAILDRIMNDINARRPVDKADLQLFRSEQHDISVQLANVRSQIEKARGGAVSETRHRAGKAKRWVVAAGSIAALSHAAGVLAGGVGVAATAAVASAGAANALQAGAQGDIVRQVESMQIRHDDAVSEHVSLQAQFQEAVQGLGEDNRREAIHAGNAEQRVREQRKLGHDAVGPRGEAGSWTPAELQHDPAKVQDDRAASVSSAGGGGSHDRETARQAVLDVLRDLVRSANQNDAKSPTKAETTIDRLKAQSTARLATATSQRPTGLKTPSAVRHHTVSPSPQQGAQPRKLGSPRASGLRAPSVFSGASIKDARRTASLSASPAPGDGFVVDGGGSRLSPRARERRSAARRTPGALSQVSLDENHAGRKVEEQLLELLDARIQVAGDDEKRQSLEKLWQSLRQATRAARQQARACERTEEVLSECVDPDMRSRIMDAHQEATLRTQEAMRVCLRETMVSLEAEYRLKEERDSKAGLERDTAVADKIAEKLVEARAALEEQEERFKKQERQREESVAPQRASSIEAAPQGHDESLASSAGVREPQRSASSGAEERKSATWQQFLKRQEAAAARNQAKRAASIEPGKTPGAESVGPLSRGASESLGHASEGDRDNDGDGGRGREMGGSNDKEKGGRGTKVSQKSKQKERQGTESESERGRTKADAIASPDSSLA